MLKFDLEEALLLGLGLCLATFLVGTFGSAPGRVTHLYMLFQALLAAENQLVPWARGLLRSVFIGTGR